MDGAEFHDALTQLNQLRQTLSADKLSVGFLLGAGCPCGVRIPVAGKADETDPLIPDVKLLTTDVCAVLKADKATKVAFEKLAHTFSVDEKADVNIEHMLNRVRDFRSVAGKANVRGLSDAELQMLDQSICRAIKQRVSCSLPDGTSPYHSMAEYIGRRGLPTTEVFTTNYDVLLEQALEDRKVPYFDGFIGVTKPFFDQRAIEEGEIPARWARLWKLHGSVNWRFNRSTKSVFRTAGDADGDEVLIHPSHLKYDESRRMPYFVMFDRLRSFVKSGGRPVALVVVGYSFGDEHVNEAIVDALKLNPSSACFALQFGNLADYPQGAALAGKNVNLSLLARDGAVIRRKKANWAIRESVDPAKLGMAFEVDGDDTDVSEEPRACRLALGDFLTFGNFLEQFAPSAQPIAEGTTG
jgi:hypothetical protein